MLNYVKGNSQWAPSRKSSCPKGSLPFICLHLGMQGFFQRMTFYIKKEITEIHSSSTNKLPVLHMKKVTRFAQSCKSIH